jgi:hypothetical protein
MGFPSRCFVQIVDDIAVCYVGSVCWCAWMSQTPPTAAPGCAYGQRCTLPAVAISRIRNCSSLGGTWKQSAVSKQQ